MSGNHAIRRAGAASILAVAAVACGSGDSSSGAAAGSSAAAAAAGTGGQSEAGVDSSGATAGTSSSTGGTSTSGGAGAGAQAGSGGYGEGGSGAWGGSGAGAAGSGAPSAADLLALLASCNQVSNGMYKTDDDSTSADIAICGLTGAVFWRADMDIDCDGKQSTQCNLGTDPAYQSETSATDSTGAYLDSASLPYVVVPLASSRFDYSSAGLSFGSVIVVIYNGQLNYGVFGDEGPSNIIGEASYAMAQSLGIDPDPSYGGVDTGVSYIAFTGSSGVVTHLEDYNEATTVGQARAAQLLQDN